MCRIVRVLERGEPALGAQRQQAEDAQLIRRRDHDGPAGPGNGRQLSKECPGVFEVLDRLHRDDEIAACRIDGPHGTVEVDGAELEVVREAAVAHRVEATVAGEARRHGAPQRAAAASDVDEPPAAEAVRIDRGRHHVVDRLFARAQALARACLELRVPQRDRHRHARTRQVRREQIRASGSGSRDRRRPPRAPARQRPVLRAPYDPR